ncbi:hypothetical protein Amal_03185 [Acetobacter malorum]|uniref:Uncharacterized protein n=1 Tax=Acetobacter malorum TaxID=178901 RepID=A0A177G5T7_9PROT|nr:hypothetical protein [Acetobacter malorum]OAG75632.1 hypothetical protein Amal_03185 [Acetobacter malorum]
MYGTLGLWYEPCAKEETDQNGKVFSPCAEIHVNLWRDVAYKFNFFDFGMLIENIENLDKIFLYIPTLVKKEQICDLGKSLKEGDTLNAVFNDVYNINKEFDGYFLVSKAGSSNIGKKIIYEINVDNCIELSEVSIGGGSRGTILSISCKFIKFMKESDVKDHNNIKKYIRLRIFLDKNSKNIFTSDDKSSDIGFSISQNLTEVTEFRFNERRSYPPDVLKRSFSGKQFNIKSIYYFLIRNKGYTLKSQHQNFKKIRFLEPGIWDIYASCGNTKRKILRLNQSMMIYQWRMSAVEGSDGIEDFTAYASFERSRLKFISYIVVLLAFGGVGGAVLNILVDYMKIYMHSTGFKEGVLTLWNSSSDQTVADLVRDIRYNSLSFLILMIAAFFSDNFFSCKKVRIELMGEVSN